MKTVNCIIAIGMILGASQAFAHNREENNLTPLERATEHLTTGCGGAIVQTPLPGTQFAGPAITMPEGAISFYEEAARHHVTWLSEMKCRDTGRTHVLKPSLENTTYKSSTNWSGYQISNTAQYVQTGFTVPRVVQPKPQYSTVGYYSSTWSGIGGGYGASTPLIQSGTSQDFNGTTASYYAWYEVVGGPGDTGHEIAITNLPVKAGDVVGSVVYWQQSLNQSVMGVCNFTSNTCVNHTVPGTGQPGKSVEWIMEAPTQFITTMPLADYGSVTFVNSCWAAVYAQDSTCSPISVPGVTNPIDITMYQTYWGFNDPISQPGPLSTTSGGSTFTVTYIQPER